MTAVLISRVIAIFEYLLQVPASRMGYDYFSAAPLKTIAVFSALYFNELFGFSDAVGFACIATGGFFVFHKW